MLNRVEANIMSYIFDKCKGQGKVVFTPKELLFSLMPKTELTAKQLDLTIKNLGIDDYIESEKCEKDGQQYFVIALTTRGAAYDRERRSIMRERVQSVLWKIGLAIVGAVVGWAVLQVINTL